MNIIIEGRVKEGKTTMAIFLFDILYGMGARISLKDKDINYLEPRSVIRKRIKSIIENKKVTIKTVQLPRK